MNQIINVQNNNGELLVSARELHEKLQIGTRYNDWFNRMLDYGFEENVDYIKISNNKETSQKNKVLFNDHIIGIDMAKEICLLNKRSKYKDGILECLYKYKSDNLCIVYKDRKEIEFGKLLKGITNMDWKEQYPIENGKYRLDFYLKDTLIVEYQEKHHKYQKEKDLIRIKECVKWLSENECDDNWKCPVIFVEEDKELEGLNRIIRHLAGFEKFDTQYDYNLEVCERL